MVDLPPDIKLRVFDLLNVQDIHSLRLTCRTWFLISETRIVWLQAMRRLLLMAPERRTMRTLKDMPLEWLKRECFRVAHMLRRWVMTDIQATIVQDLPCPRNVQYALLMRGGEWLVLVLSNGTALLQRVRDMSRTSLPNRSVPTLDQLYCSLSESEWEGSNLLLTTGYRSDDDTGHIRLYVIDPAQASITNIPVPDTAGNVTVACAGHNLLIYGCVEDLLTVRTIPYRAEDPIYQIVLKTEPPIDTVTCTIALLSRQRFFLADGDGTFIFEIPELRLWKEDDEFDETVVIEPFAFVTFNLTLNPPPVSSVFWDHLEDGHTQPLLIIDYHHLHVLTLYPTVFHHRHVLPDKDNGDLITTGFRRGLFWRDNERLPRGARAFQLSTWAFPDMVPLNMASEHVARWVTRFPIEMGSILVPCDDGESIDYLNFDEWTGRICILKAGGPHGRRMIVMDVV